MLNEQIVTEIIIAVGKVLPHARTHIIGVDGDKDTKSDHSATISVPNIGINIKAGDGTLLIISVHKDMTYDYGNPDFPDNVVADLIKLLRI